MITLLKNIYFKYFKKQTNCFLSKIDIVKTIPVDRIKYSDIEITSIYCDIIAYTTALKQINTYNTQREYIKYQQQWPVETSLTNWCTDNTYFIANLETRLLDWLEQITITYNTYISGINKVGSGKRYSNAVKLQSHIINMELIIDNMIKCK